MMETSLRDASAFFGAWAFAGLPAPSLSELVGQYRAAGVDGAALSPVEAVLQPEPMAGNLQMLRALISAGGKDFAVRAVPIINPSLPSWDDDVTTCLSESGPLVRAFKVVPNYHNFALDHRASDALAEACTDRRLGLCVQMRMEDERSHHPLMKVSPVESAAVVALARRHPRLSILVCAPYMAELRAYRDCPNVQAELSMVESGFLLQDALRHISADRLLLGTHAPIHMIAPSVAKLQSDELDDETLMKLSGGNFNRFFGSR